MVFTYQFREKFIFLVIILYQLKINSVMSIIDGISSNLTILNKTDDSFTKTTQNTPDFVVYTFPVLIIVGTICNILTFLVMRRKKLRHQSTGFYMAVLAIADELALLLGCLSQWLWSYKKINILTISTYACKIFSVVLYTTFDFSVWMVVIMTIERFIAVTFPLKSMYFCTVKKAKIATLILTCILFSINSHFLYTHSNIDRGNVSGCQSNNESFDFFMQHLWPWIDATKYAFTPFLIILVFNVLIIYNLFIAAKSIKNLSSNHQLQVNHITHGNSNSPNLKDANNHGNANSQSSSSNNRRLTIMLLVVSVTFCILSTPVVILQVFDRTSPGSTSMFFYNICINLQYVNHSINFFLYGIIKI